MSKAIATGSQWYVYILRCGDSSLYTGITTDVERRLQEHNSDDRLAARYTRPRRPVKLAYAEESPSRSAALKREHEIKRMTRSAKKRLISRP